SPSANPRRFGPTKSTFIITVIDQHNAWLTPSNRFATSNQNQRLAKIMMNGTGRPTSQPTTNTFLRPTVSETRAANRLQMAFVTPKLTMKETMAVLETSPNSFSPINGTTVLSRPTIIPTNTLIRTRSENWPTFSRRPNFISPCSSSIAGCSLQRGSPPYRKPRGLYSVPYADTPLLLACTLAASGGGVGMFCVIWRTNSSLSSIWKALLNLRSKPIVDIGLPLKDRPQTEPE